MLKLIKQILVPFRKGSYKSTITSYEKEKLLSFKDKFKNKRCFIIGNGPSLNKIDLNILKNEYTFAVNSIFYKTKEMGFKPTFYVVEDQHVLSDNLTEINSYEVNYKFFPSNYKKFIKNNKNTFFFPFDIGFYREEHLSYKKPRFAKDISEVIYAGQTVTYINLQLAFYMGFTEIYLIGMDFDYKIPKSAIVNGNTIESVENDPNHFHPDYFGKGKKWHNPDLDSVMYNYKKAKETFENENRKIFNATKGGKLELFERVDFDKLIRGMDVIQ